MAAASDFPPYTSREAAELHASLMWRRAARGNAGPIGPVAVAGYQDPNGTMQVHLPPGEPLALPEGLYSQHMECVDKTLFGGREGRLYNESLVKPRGIDLDLWIASHLVQYTEYGRVLFYYITTDVCTPEKCPTMCAGQHVHYSWTDEATGRNVSLSAPAYMETLLKGSYDYIKSLPLGPPYPPDFKARASQYLKRIFRLFAHLYLNHFDVLRAEGVEENVNYLFKRFLYFVLDFELVARADMAPLSHFIAALEAQRENRRLQAAA